MSIIDIRNLSRHFGSKTALDRVSLEINEGDLFGLFGPNGAGKTTLLRILTGQLEPDSGEARVMDIDVSKDPMAVKRVIGIVPEVESPPTYLTSYEYLFFVGRVRGINGLEKRIGNWFDFLELDDVRDTLCRDLSKGMRQKLMLASAFIHEPKLVFLDEPFINLDPIFQRKMRDYLSEYISTGGTAFMCSHILEVSERLCNNVAIIDAGRILISGNIRNLVREGDSLEDLFMRLVRKGGGSRREPSSG